MQIFDLSVDINEQTPVYPGDPSVKIEPAARLEKDGDNDYLISFGTHTGTHIDAPAHMLEAGKSLSQLPIEQFIGKAHIVKVGATFELGDIEAAGIQSGDIVLFDTGMAGRLHEAGYFEDYPVMPAGVADFLVSLKVKMVGFDTCSADNAADFPIHKILLAGDVLIIENLTNLSDLAGKDFTVYALPLKLDLDGAPARVIAVIE